MVLQIEGELLQIEAVITKQGSYYKFGQLLQNGTQHPPPASTPSFSSGVRFKWFMS